MHQHLGPGRADRGFHGLAVEDVEDDRLDAEPTEVVDLAGRAGRGVDVVSRGRRSGTRRLPTAPVPPAMKTFIVVSFPGSPSETNGHTPL